MTDNAFVVLCCVGLLGLFLLGNIACAAVPSAERAERAAANVGVENPHVVKRSPAWGVLGGCHENDLTKFTVKGTNRTVQVCAPLIGGYTVRS